LHVLGIETSCDETAAAVVDERGNVLSDVVHSQVSVHAPYGGVVPELASRDHLRNVRPVIREAVLAASLSMPEIDGIAVTCRPGLKGALLVGVAAAEGLGWALGKPVVGVDHLVGHLLSVYLERPDIPRSEPPPEVPFVALLVSGGHTALYRVDGFSPDRIRELGATRDDAAGEAFDKVAKLLGLGYPGGPAIDLLAAHGDDRAVPFPKTRLTHADRNAPELPGRSDFSFSGLKTAVLRHVTALRAERGLAPDAPLPRQHVSDIAASFQRVVVETLLDRLFETARSHGARSVGIAGGVSANSRLRADAAARGAARGLPVFIPSMALSTDNAAMIGAAGLRRYRAGLAATLDIDADASLALRTT